MANEKFPFSSYYDFLNSCRKYDTIILVFSSSISILVPLIQTYYASSAILINLLNFLNVLFLILYYVINTSTEIFIYPATAIKRRQGLIDNSFGSKLLDKPLDGYFSNDNIPFGAYKLAVNCFENCFFTYNISRTQTLRIVIKNTVCLIVFLLCAYFGFQKNVIAVPLIQFLTSSIFLKELIYQLNFTSKLRNLYERFLLFFSQKEKQQDIAHSIFLMLDYETILAYNKSPLSDKEWKRLEKPLSQQWEDIKNRYEINGQ